MAVPRGASRQLSVRDRRDLRCRFRGNVLGVLQNAKLRGPTRSHPFAFLRGEKNARVQNGILIASGGPKETLF